MMNVPQQARSEETRARILQAALELFAKNGYEITGVAEICEKSGVSKGAFYHHFPTKQSIFIVLLEEWLSGLEKELEAAAAQATSVPEALRNMASRMQGVLQLANGQISIFLEFWVQARRDPEVWERTIKPFRHYRKIFERLIRKGIEEGSIEKVDPALTAQALISMAVGTLLQGVADPAGARWDEVTVRSVELFIQAILRRNA
jgi:AcrR family transcriptional regulator